MWFVKVFSHHAIHLSFAKISGPVAFYQFLLNFELLVILSVLPITSVYIVPVSQLVHYCPHHHPPHPHQLGSFLRLFIHKSLFNGVQIAHD
jgi:uncharacterized membrane protein